LQLEFLKSVRDWLAMGLIQILLCSPSWAGNWVLQGPSGGDARSLSYDPQNPSRIFLGTSAGSIFISNDGGASWSRFAHLGSRDQYVIDHIIIDPRNPAIMFVSAWDVEDSNSGNVFRSQDGGKTWATLSGMREKSVRVLAMAASDANVLVCGTLDGVYRSVDSGANWQRISPLNHAEIRNVESISIDQNDPDVIYVGTWHLPWKTTDGGASWHQISKGMLDDSDVFSMIVDSKDRSVVYVSACSGIYKSETGGEVFRKISGIPFAARRTRVLKQDPSNANMIYAGTTQGLWKTSDAGKTWKQVSDPGIVVNDILIDPRNSLRLLLATDRGGVMISDNGGTNLWSSNSGYSHHYVTTVLADTNDPGAILVGIANDHEWGGVFCFHDGGVWQQRSAGLGGRDVFALAQTPDGTLIAGTNRGLFTLDRNTDTWRPSGIAVTGSTLVAGRTFRNMGLDHLSVTQALMKARVNDIEVAPFAWLAATSSGLFTSTDGGANWNGGPVLGRKEFVSVHYAGRLLLACTQTEVLLSIDHGMNWQVANIPPQVTSVRGTVVTPDKKILIASSEGVFRSSNLGETWQPVSNGLPETDLSSISYDNLAGTLLATSLSSSTVFHSQDGGSSWSPGPDLGYPLRRVVVLKDRFVAITPFDGIVLQQ
jgi:photosystem II stability/assembly factor-like uncharacterized protein